jgi:hypothetical protein
MSSSTCFDTLALLKLYLREAGSVEISELFGGSERGACHEITYVERDTDLLERAADLAEGFALRGYGAVHLASADRLRMALSGTRFVSFDHGLNRAAKLLGFTLPSFVPLT